MIWCCYVISTIGCFTKCNKVLKKHGRGKELFGGNYDSSRLASFSSTDEENENTHSVKEYDFTGIILDTSENENIAPDTSENEGDNNIDLFEKLLK